MDEDLKTDALKAMNEVVNDNIHKLYPDYSFAGIREVFNPGKGRAPSTALSNRVNGLRFLRGFLMEEGGYPCVKVNLILRREEGDNVFPDYSVKELLDGSHH
jgi:hypothetical protein